MLPRFYPFFLLVSVFYATQGQQCYETKSDFQRSCSIVHNGVVDGGRCFFLRGQVLGYSPFNWTEAWAECARRGGTMAQIHTSHEFAAVSAYLAILFSNQSKLISIALSRDPTLTSTTTGHSMDLQKTRWYDDATNYNPLLTVGNTWIQAHEGDDAFALDNNCYQFWGTFTKIGDCPCNSTYRTLCTVYNSIQNFSLTTTSYGNCMAETVIQAFTAVASTAECATHCSSYIWCRGYNYYQAGQKCELFSWYYGDTKKFVTNSDCYHYAYVP